MKFFYDSEFIEGFLPNRLLGLPLPNWLSKRRHAIDLISIAIVAEDGDEYSAISSEYKYPDASDWVKENVITPLYTSTVSGDMRNIVGVDRFQRWYGKSNKQIAEEIKEFVYRKIGLVKPAHLRNFDVVKHLYPTIEIYGYYSAYDHVLLQSIFGTMMDLPEGFPMYTIDLKQMLDENAVSIYMSLTRGLGAAHKRLLSHERILSFIKASNLYPKLADEHLAISDARWNKKLFEFIENT